MASTEREEEMQDRLVLQVKAFSLLYGSEEELRARLEGRLIHSNDESIKKFVRAMQVAAPKRTGRILAIAVGELVMASLLVIAASVVLVPTIIGVNTYNALVQYFTQSASTALSGSPLSPYVTFVEFAVGLVLMVFAFFALHEAALSLKQAGLTVKKGDA